MTNYFHLLSIGLIIGLSLVSCSKDSAPNFHRLSVITTPSEGGTVTPGSGEYEEGTEIELTAKPNEDWAFEKWHGDYDGNSPVATIKMDSSMVIVASFIKRDYPLTILIEGEGQVLQEIVRSKSTDYPHGTTVKLTAEPDHGWYFSHWEGDLESEENPEEITVEDATDVTAVFERLDFPLTVDVEGNGTVTQQIVPAKTTDYTFETVIELTASADPGWSFARWEGDLEGNENPIQITIDNEKEVTAVFEENPYTLTVVIEGEGEVEQSVLPSKETVYPFGSNVSLEAFPAENWSFSHWNKDKEQTDNPMAVLVDRDITITATFYTIPVLTTKEVTNITDSSAVSGGLFSNTSDFTITAKGVCFGTSENPRLNDGCTNNGNNDDEFSSLMSDLIPDTQYFVRAYATYRGGTIYGNQIGFTTEKEISVPGPPVLTDVIAGDGEITVHFEAPEDDGGSPVTHYEYRLNADADDPVVDIGLDSPFTIREGENDGEGAYKIINGEEYTVRLRAVNAAGAGDWAEAEMVIPQPLIYLGKNGVTIMCPKAPVGYKGIVDGVEYEVVNRVLLDQRISERDDVTKVCTSLVTDMSELFYRTSNFNQEIGSWDVSNVVDMSRMFSSQSYRYSSSFNQDISHWDVGNVTDMSGMFAGYGWYQEDEERYPIYHRSSFNSDISNWDVSNVKDMSRMFRSSRFNQNIENWDVSNVTDMSEMFSLSVFNQNIGKWNVSNVKDMSGMFGSEERFHIDYYNGGSLSNLDINNWDVSSVTNMSKMFIWSHFDHKINDWDVSNVTDMSDMFNNSFFNQSLDNWDVSNVTNMSGMFHRSYFNQDINNWNVSSVLNMKDMFSASVYKQDIGKWDVNNVTDMSGMFAATHFNQDIGKWNVGNVEDMKGMFSEAEYFNQDLSGWCVDNIPYKPTGFDHLANNWELPRPIWGTCPGED